LVKLRLSMWTNENSGGVGSYGGGGGGGIRSPVNLDRGERRDREGETERGREE